MIKAGAGLPGGPSGRRAIPGTTADFLCDWARAEGPDSVSMSQRTPGAMPWDYGQGVCGVRALLCAAYKLPLKSKPRQEYEAITRPGLGQDLGKNLQGKVFACWRGDGHHLGCGHTTSRRFGWPGWVGAHGTAPAAGTKQGFELRLS